MIKAKIGIPFKYFASIVAIFILATQSLQAQKYWTLQECIDQAIKNNITVQQRELAKQSVEADFKQSKLAALPSINGQATQFYQNGFAINPATNTAQTDMTFRNNNFGLSSSTVLFNGFQQTNTIRLQQNNYKANEQDVEAIKNNIRLNVANAYLQVLMNNEILESSNIQVQSTKEQINKQQKLVDFGAANKVKLLQLKAQLSNEELVIINNQNLVEQSYLTLWQTLNIDPDSSNKIIKPELSAEKITSEIRSPKDIYDTYILQSPDVKAAEIRSRVAEISKFVSLGGRSVRLTMTASISSLFSTQSQQGVGAQTITNIPIGFDILGNPVVRPTATYSEFGVTPFSDQINRNLGKSIGFTMAVPIFNGWQVNTSIQKAKINEFTAHLNVKQVQLDLYKNIVQAHQNLKASEKRYDATKNSFDANKESFSLAEGQFGLGAISTVEYLSTKNEFLKAQASFVQAKYELVFRRKVLDFYLGKPLY